MNRSELVKIVARKVDVPVPLADEVVRQFLDLIVLNIATDEEVGLRGFGKFRPAERRGITLLNPRTKIPMEIDARRTVVFLPSVGVKRRLNAHEF